MNKVTVAVVLACVCALACVADAKSCHVYAEEDGKNYYYDLSQIGELYVDPGDGSKYRLNMCDGVSKGCPSTTAVCMEDSDTNEFVSLGKLSTRSSVPLGGEEPGEGVVVLFGQGDACPGSVYTSTVLVLCDPTQMTPIVEVLPDDCDYSFQVVTKYGCGKVVTSSQVPPESQDDSDDSDLDHGEVVAIVILVLLLFSVITYFAIGAIWQKKNNDPATFTDYIIHFEFWASIPGLVVDGCKFIAHGFKRGDYVSV